MCRNQGQQSRSVEKGSEDQRYGHTGDPHLLSGSVYLMAVTLHSNSSLHGQFWEGVGNNPGTQRMASLTWKAGTEKLFLLRPAKGPQLGPTFPCFLLPAMRPCIFLGRCIHSWSSCPACGATLPKQTGKSCSSGTCVQLGGVRRSESWLYLDCHVSMSFVHAQ